MASSSASIERVHAQTAVIERIAVTAIESMADSLVGVRLLLAGGDVDLPYVARQRYRIGSCLDWLEERITPDGFWPEVFSIMDLNLLCPLLWGVR
jgi:hypothetical protein